MHSDKSWRTTVGGIVAIAAGVIWGVGEWAGIDIPVVTDASSAIAAISAGVALLVAKDDKKQD